MGDDRAAPQGLEYITLHSLRMQWRKGISPCGQTKAVGRRAVDLQPDFRQACWGCWEGGRWQFFLFICFGFFYLPQNVTMSTPSQQVNSTGGVEGKSLPQSGTALVSRVHICYKWGGSASRIADHGHFTARLLWQSFMLQASSSMSCFVSAHFQNTKSKVLSGSA